MNKDFRLALLKNWKNNIREKVIDFTRYDMKAIEPAGMTRKWSLLGEIIKSNRARKKPVLLDSLPVKSKSIIANRYPNLFGNI